MTAKNLTFALAVILALASASQAGVIGMTITEISNAAGGAALANFRTFDIRVNATGSMRSQGMLLELTQGSIYQDSFGSNVVPSSSFYALAPSLQFDTFVTFGAGGTPGPPGTVQQSTDILTPGGTGAEIPGGGSGVTFNNQKLDIVWAPGGGINYPGTNNFMTARITLSKDAWGYSQVLWKHQHGHLVGDMVPHACVWPSDCARLWHSVPADDRSRQYWGARHCPRDDGQAAQCDRRSAVDKPHANHGPSRGNSTDADGRRLVLLGSHRLNNRAQRKRKGRLRMVG
jgi:hypothetical protein